MVQNTPMGDANCAEERPADPAPDERHGRRPERPFRPPRGVPLVATWTRWAASASAVAAGLVLLAEGCVLVAHSGRTLASFGGWLVLACAVQAPLVLALLRAEELRLSRELRTARTGTPALRAMVAHRRAQAPFFARSFSSGLGTAAVLLADGERDGARRALAGGSPLMQGGRLGLLRSLVDADLDRATGAAGAVTRCVRRLRATKPIGHREADLYRTHVLVKAVLQQGDADAGLEIASELASSLDEEERMYATWLRVWFDLDAEGDAAGAPWPTLTDGDLRLAALAARAHGADRLFERLHARLEAIARTEPGG